VFYRFFNEDKSSLNGGDFIKTNVLRTGPEFEPVWSLVQGLTGRTGSTVIEPE
jgi:hypothetical protein